MTLHMKNPPAGGADGLVKTSLPGGNDCPSNAPEIAPAQIKFQDPAEAFDDRAPHGRSRPFRLTPDELDELIDVALRLERRRA
jgi:hypothetical protein